MRIAGTILALLFATATASAQATFELVGAPDAGIGAVGWTVPGGPPPPPTRAALTPEYRLPDPPMRPTPQDQPESQLFSIPSPPPPKPEPKRRPPVAGVYLEVLNRGERVIKAVGWEVSLVDKASGMERRLRFRTEAEVRPGQTVAQKHEFPLDADWRWLAASKGRGVRMLVKIEHLVYADGTEWRRQ